MCLLARRPWTRRLRLDASLPSGVRGPVDFFAFWRLASIWASLGEVDFVVFVICVNWGTAPLLAFRIGGKFGEGLEVCCKRLKTGQRNSFWGCDWRTGAGRLAKRRLSVNA